VCNAGHIRGQQGVALDDMVYVMTRMARQMEEVSAPFFSLFFSLFISACLVPVQLTMGSVHSPNP
jgi:hypothetical protein